ncbi:MAG: DPP IV N-terminal domain-containing protein [Verrucomicrobia bacterium]|nr:DPP IV N-terminal domain-containing protein [Verrucomicrobiota bacterium]
MHSTHKTQLLETRIKLLIVSLLIGAVSAPARCSAEQVVRVTKTFGTIAIDTTALQARGGHAGRTVAETIRTDLKRSGWFTTAPSAKAAYVVQGICEGGGGQVSASVTVSSAAGEAVLNRAYEMSATQARQLAHRVADEIVYQLTGHKGIASTRIVMVGSRDGAKELYICDADGENLRALTSDRSVSLTPRWDAQGRRLVYTSFKSGFPDVYLIDLSTSQRERIAKFPGLNTGADFSPDGRNVALTLSKDGNPDLYLMALRGSKLTRLTRTRQAGETSPSFSPEGRQIAFVSDSSGSPQLYVIDRAGGDRRRLSFEGRENVDPDWGPDGRIVYSSRRFGKYQVCIYDPKTRQDRQLTHQDVDHEDPSWAPDGRHVVYTRTQAFDSRIYILDTVNGASIALHNLNGTWYTPAWSPN